MSEADLAFAGAITLVTTHVLWLPSLVIAWRYQLALLAGVILNILLFSTTYHACLSFSACPLNTSPAVTRRVDNWTSLTGLCAGILLFVTEVPATSRVSLYENYGHVEQRSRKRRAPLSMPPPWDYTRILFEQYVLQTVGTVLMLGVFVIVFTSDIDNITTFLYCIGFAANLALVKLIVMGEPRYPLQSIHTWKGVYLFVTGLLIVGVGVVFFSLPNYLVSHNIWHAIVPIGVLLIAISIARPQISFTGIFRIAARNVRRLTRHVRSCCAVSDKDGYDYLAEEADGADDDEISRIRNSLDPTRSHTE